jgi:4'-phosphopantetheinyl transferase
MDKWLLPPDAIPPLGQNVHVWAVGLDDPGFAAEHWRNWLSLEEQARASKFKFGRDQIRYIIAHAAVRAILARYTSEEAANLKFVVGPNGKPKLAAPWSASGVEFNLSHSHERALIAVNSGAEVGVDIEFVRADFEFHEIARHFFTKREAAALRELPEELQRRAFYRCWTSKEAFLKAKGTGLSGKLDEVEITLAGELQIQIHARVAGWSLVALHPGGAYESALVCESRPAEVICYRWQPPW